jgi:hypothetical protein
MSEMLPMHTVLSQNLSSLHFDLLRVQYNLAGRAGDLEINLDRSFVFPRATKLQVEEGDVVVERLGPVTVLALCQQAYYRKKTRDQI